MTAVTRPALQQPDLPRAYALFQSSFTGQHELTVMKLRRYQLGDDTPHNLVPAPILRDPVVLSAVEAMLGPGAGPDVCRHVHVQPPSASGSDWHQDDYDGKPWPDAHEWAILFYFPQATPPEMGGTGILVDGQEVIAAGPAGTCLLARGDVVHRARANTTGQTRYMLKYLFRGAQS